MRLSTRQVLGMALAMCALAACATDPFVIPEPERGPDYSYSDLRNEDLRGASLRYADFDLSDLSGALLKDADLAGANL